MASTDYKSTDGWQCVCNLLDLPTTQDRQAMRRRLIERIQAADFTSSPSMVEAADFIAGRQPLSQSTLDRSLSLRIDRLAQRFFRLPPGERSNELKELTQLCEGDSKLTARLDWLRAGVELEQDPASKLNGSARKHAAWILNWFTASTTTPRSLRVALYSEQNGFAGSVRQAWDSLNRQAPSIAALVGPCQDQFLPQVDDLESVSNDMAIERPPEVPQDLVDTYRAESSAKVTQVDYRSLRDSIPKPLPATGPSYHSCEPARLGFYDFLRMHGQSIARYLCLLIVPLLLCFGEADAILDFIGGGKNRSVVVDQYCEELKQLNDVSMSTPPTTIIPFPDSALHADRPDAVRAINQFAQTCETKALWIRRDREIASQQVGEINRVIQKARKLKPCCDKHMRQIGRDIDSLESTRDRFLISDPRNDGNRVKRDPTKRNGADGRSASRANELSHPGNDR